MTINNSGPHFYIALDGSRGFPNYNFKNRNLLVSAGSLWSNERNKFIHRTIPICKHFFLDSGGFSLLNKYGEYPFTINEYIKLVLHYNPDHVAIMDYPCEPSINRNRIKTNKERIEKTLDNTIKAIRMEWMCELTQFVPVIQGYTLDEYKYCIDRMLELDIFQDHDYVAVGTMCRRMGNNELRRLIFGITNYVWSTQPNTKFHFFGLKLTALRDFICAERIYSCDSMAWDIKHIDRTRMYPRTEGEKIDCLDHYLKKIDAIVYTHTRQQQITLDNIWGKV